ncbi:kinase-like domain-containing protein [Amylocarpus encephaloides]|uniref:Kinase-like domain-containing protein n=1 Tax=Amylocarpus encephaloides TaxID=45428 RepID=A0A9P7YAY3_9HELO|nr:kinase-like domain-containing protein [Amylocarpus encephaloides]
MAGSNVDEISNPGFQLNDVPLVRADTLPIGANEDLPVIGDQPLEILLRDHQVKHKSGRPEDHFWSLKLLLHILSRGRVLAELERYPNLENISRYLDVIRPDHDQELCFNTRIQFETLGTEHSHAPASSSQTYLRTFALLVYLGRGSEIASFVEEEISDQNLPVYTQEGPQNNATLCLKKNPHQPLNSVRHWSISDREQFETRQWQFLVPYFDLENGSLARHYKFNPRIRFPWFPSSSQPLVQPGGYGDVTCIKIDSLSHGFGEILEKFSLKQEYFALKMLHQAGHNDETKFRNEMEQLQRFNGFVNKHLITLLASYTYENKYHFIFPWANGNLETFMTEAHVKKPILTVTTARWLAQQLSGIMAAIDHIHNPEHLYLITEEQKYGKHGDIKPDNILWFQSTSDPMGILVISDLGLSTLNRAISRSNIPNEKVPKVPLYRPPECDVTGGTISRAYDIWTLGCLFLDVTTWYLGGCALLNAFEETRCSTYILTGGDNNMFFELERLDTEDRLVYVAQVKPQVISWFTKLHNHEDCTQFIHDALKIVETQMLVIISEGTERASSKVLRKQFEGLTSKCMDDNQLDYCTKGIPLEYKPEPANVVKVELNDAAREMIARNHSAIPIHTRKTGEKIRNSRSRQDMENIDRIH